MELLVYSSLLGISLFLVVYSVYRIFADVPHQDRQYLDRPPLMLRMLWPLIQLVSHYFVHWWIWDAYRTRTLKRLSHAGQDFALNPEQFVSAKIVSALFGLGFAYIVLHTLDSVSMFSVLIISVIGFFYPDLWLWETRKKRNLAILKSLPFFLDVITLSVEGGLNLTGGLGQAVDKGPSGPLKNELGRVLRDIRAGKPRADAMRDMADRIELPAIGSLVSALIQAETVGMSLGPVLRAQGDQRRSERFLRAEKLAMEAPVKMLAPLVMFIFPNTFIILGFPIVMKFLHSGIL